MTYITLLHKIMTSGSEELNIRTGLKTKRNIGEIVELNEGYLFSPRKVSPRIAAAEIAWMLGGTHSTAWLSQYTKIWKKFEDDYFPGFISTAYGYRWKVAFGRDQIHEAIQLLEKDPSTRQALVMSWDARTDGLMRQGMDKNVPCPFAFSFYIVKGVGHIMVYQRSADVVVGLPYDLMAYYMIGQAVFNTLQLPFDGVTIAIGDAHIYESHYDIADKMLESKIPNFPHCLDHKFTIPSIIKHPDAFVAENSHSYDEVDFPLTDKLEAAQ